MVSNLLRSFDTLDYILMVVKSSDNRLSSSSKYVFSRMEKKHLTVLVTIKYTVINQQTWESTMEAFASYNIILLSQHFLLLACCVVAVVIDFGSWSFTPIFELFTDPLSFHLSNSCILKIRNNF